MQSPLSQEPSVTLNSSSQAIRSTRSDFVRPPPNFKTKITIPSPLASLGTFLANFHRYQEKVQTSAIVSYKTPMHVSCIVIAALRTALTVRSFHCNEPSSSN